MKTLLAASVLATTVLLAGCATSLPAGSFYTAVKLPVEATSNGSVPTRVGRAQCTSVLHLFATGDCSIDTAKKNGNITKVNHIDWDANNILGIYGKYTVTVYGE